MAAPMLQKKHQLMAMAMAIVAIMATALSGIALSQGTVQPGDNPDYPVLQRGTTCPDWNDPNLEGPVIIPYQYFMSQNGRWFISSNQTLRPYSMDPIPIEQLQSSLLEPVVNKTCNEYGACIEAYELVVDFTVVELGFYNNETGEPIATQFITYNGEVPGPRFEVEMGVQSLVRVRNHAFCDTETNTPMNMTGWYAEIGSTALHYHGSASLAPFDGWANDAIYRCQWKDYVYPNNKPNSPNWYHDHTVLVTGFSVPAGLVGTYYTKNCGDETLPVPIAALGQEAPQYLVLHDQLFIQGTDEEYMSPGVNLHLTILPDPGPESGFGGRSFTGNSAGDHIFVNGNAWPVVTVQRKPYWWTLLDGCASREFTVQFFDAQTNRSLNSDLGKVWIVGSEGGFRTSPVQASAGIFISPGERYSIVVDFSSFNPGDIIYMYNSQPAGTDGFCYETELMKIIVADDEPVSAPFNPNYQVPIFANTFVTINELTDACQRANSGDIDITMWTRNRFVFDAPGQDGSSSRAFTSATTSTTSSEVEAEGGWYAVYLGEAGTGAYNATVPPADDMPMRKSRKLNQELITEPEMPTDDNNGVYNPGKGGEQNLYLPQSFAEHGWATLNVYNQDGAAHPIHMHQLDFFICSRQNTANPNGANAGLHSYETLVAKDVFYVAGQDNVTAVARFGPSQGSYMFHCHNLFHEDEGLMAVFNVTSPIVPNIADPEFINGTLDMTKFLGFGTAPTSPGFYNGEDPLVYNLPDYPEVGHNLYFPQSMPAWAMRHDPENPGYPQPLTEDLLQAVLIRNYYPNNYPPARPLWMPVNNNPYAVVCPAAVPTGEE